jgi:hypothetical protein
MHSHRRRGKNTVCFTYPSPMIADHWEVLQHAHPRYRTASDDVLVATMLACGNPGSCTCILRLNTRDLRGDRHRSKKA